jgi:hypothetical protein
VVIGPNLSQLRELDGDNLDFVWHIVGTGANDFRAVIRHRGETLWTEPTYYEGIDRLCEVRGLLRDRYGDRLRFLLPTPASHPTCWATAPRRAIPTYSLTFRISS